MFLIGLYENYLFEHSFSVLMLGVTLLPIFVYLLLIRVTPSIQLPGVSEKK